MKAKIHETHSQENPELSRLKTINSFLEIFSPDEHIENAIKKISYEEMKKNEYESNIVNKILDNETAFQHNLQKICKLIFN